MTASDYIDLFEVHLRQTEAIHCCTLPWLMPGKRLLWDFRTSGHVSQSAETARLPSPQRATVVARQLFEIILLKVVMLE